MKPISRTGPRHLPSWRQGTLLLLATAGLACRDDAGVAPAPPRIVETVASVVVTASRQVLSPGDSARYTAQAFDAQGRVLPTVTFTWSSGNPAVATVNGQGVVTATATGSTTITATADGQSGTADLVVSITQLCECTRIIDSTAATLVARNDTTGVYVFRVLASQPPAIEAGNIIVGAENGGFLRRVEGSTLSGDLLTVQTTLAYLDEAVQTGDFAATSSTDGESVPFDSAATRWGAWTTTYVDHALVPAGAGPCCSLDGLVIAIKSDSGAHLPGPVQVTGEFTVKDGDIDFLPRLELGGRISNFRLQSFRAAVRGGLALNLDLYEIKLTAALTTDKLQLKKESKTFLVQQKPFATFIGPMPLVGIITKTLKLQVTPTVSASAIFAGKFRTGFSVTAGTQWSRSGGWSPVSGSSSYFEAEAPTFQGVEGTASVKVALVPELSVQFYGVAGPKIDLEPYAEAAATAALTFANGAQTGLDWETRVSLGLNLNIGAKISILGRVDLAEASFAIPIVKPFKLVRAFSDGPLTVFTSVTGQDRPDSLGVRLRPAFVDTLPWFGIRSLSTSNQDVTVATGDSVILLDIKSGTSYPHAVTLPSLPANCTFGPDDGEARQKFEEHAETVTIGSNAFIATTGTRSAVTLTVDCIPLGALRIRTRTSGRDVTERNQLTLERVDQFGSGKGTPALTLGVPGVPTPRDTIIGGLVPENPANGASGRYTATLEPGRRNCAVAKPSSHQTRITSGDTSLTEFNITCVPLGFTRVRTTTVDPDAAPPSAPVVYRANVTESGTVSASASTAPPADELLGASAETTVDSLVPLYNASGATGRHQVRLLNAPNRCRESGQFARPVTVFPGDTAQADFAIQCVERLHVATRSTGPGVDRSGYVVVVENADGSADSVAIGTADTVAMAGVEPGEHIIRLADVDPNCVAPAAVQRLVSARDSTLVSFTVSCPGPAAPVGLRSTRVETARIDLAWDAAPGGRPIAFYRLYRSTNSATAATIIADSLPGLTHVDAGLSNYTRYAYQVAAVDPNGLVGPKSSVLQVRTLDGTPPNAPSGLTAVALSSSAINLDWASANDPESGIARYRVFRDGVLIDSTTGTSYLSRGLAPVTSYRYEVQAVNGGGLSGPLSGPASATTLDNPDTTPPSAPTGLSATPAGMTRIDLAWNAAADPETGVASYHVYRGGVRIATTTTLAYADTGLTAGTTYTYEVSAVNGVGLEGSRSAPATATTDPPPVSTGDLRIVVRTSGTNIPPTGFQLQIAGTGPPLVRQVAPNDTVVVTDLAAQVYTVTLVLPSNCTVLDGTVSRTIDVLAGATARTTYLVSCQ